MGPARRAAVGIRAGQTGAFYPRAPPDGALDKITNLILGGNDKLMKKKITAVLLTLCLVLGLLPLSAMAESWEVKLDEDTTVTLRKSGSNYTVEADGFEYYTFIKKNDSDTKFYYTYNDGTDKYDSSKEWGPYNITGTKYDITLNAGKGTWEDGSKTKVVQTDGQGMLAKPDGPEPFQATEGNATFAYTFGDWFDNTPTGAKIDFTQPFTADTTIYAYYNSETVPPEATTYTITLNPGDGTLADGDKGPLTTDEDGYVSLPTPTAPEGYTFMGWYDEDGNKVTSATKFEKNTSLTARYEESSKVTTYKITLNLGGGTLPEGVTSPLVTDGDGMVNLPTPTRKDYEFLGWFSEDGKTEYTSESEFTADTTIYAHWAAKVTFDFNDGSDEKTVVTTVDGKVTAPADPTRGLGYEFLGWYTGRTGGTKFDATTSYNTPTTFYANWGIEIHFTLHGGTLNGSDEAFVVVTGANGTLGSKMPADPTREGYTFAGWFVAEENGLGDRVDASYAFTAPTYVNADWSIVADLTERPGGTVKKPATTIEAPEDIEEFIAQKGIDRETDTVILGASDSGFSDKQKAGITEETVTVSATFIKELIQELEYLEVVEIRAVTGSVFLPRDVASTVTGNVVYKEEQRAVKSAETNAIKADLPKTGKGSPVGKVHAIEISLEDDNGPILDGTNYAEVSAYMDMGSVSYKNLAMFYLGGKTLERHEVTNYANKRITWVTDHLSPWGAIELLAEDTEGGTGGGGGNGTGGGGGGGGGGSASSGYSVSVSRTTNGTVSVSPSRAEEGDTVTITVRPNEGYELDTLTVKDADGNTIRTTNEGDGKYTFTMPDGKVTIEATFKAIEEEDTAPAPATPSFSDVPSSFWAYEQIRWVAEQGIMGGYANGTFGADNNTTRQALWMVLGRLSGELDTNSTMAEAREWAIANNVSDGTNPGNAMSRQQMVTMLYRYAQMKGYATNGSTELSTYPDAAGVASYAQDALSWAVANGVVTGTTDGRLNPEGTASRAHFAVFMYRFCGLYADEA